MSLIAELKRRNVFRVGIAYVLMAWVLLQGADFFLDLIGAPNWVIQVFALAVVLGLPVALFFAWAFELTPEGIKREQEVDRNQSITPRTGRKLDRIIIGFLVIIIGYMGVDRLYLSSGDAEPAAPSEPAAADKTIAVLPFADLSRDQDQGWFADGLAEEILNALAKTPDLQVSSRTSTLKYRDSELGISQIARELGVAHILEGSVRSGGGRIRVTAQLIRASDGFHVWSENYDRDEADMISIQEDLARNIANALETTMDPTALAEMTQAGTRSVEAYTAYLKGLKLQSDSTLHSESPEMFQQGYQQFERAREIDPDFARAHQLAAQFWQVQLSPSRTDSGVTNLTALEMLAEFNERIDRAIATASSDTDRTLFLAARAEVGLRLREALRLYQEYLAVRPNDELARFALENVANMASDHATQQAVLAHWRAMPQDQDAVSGYINEAYKVTDPSEAADFGLEALRRWPGAPSLLYQTHRTLLWAGRVKEARQLADRYYQAAPDGSQLPALRQACAEGDRETAEQIYAELDPAKNDRQNIAWHMLMLLGREAEAIQILRPLEESGVPYQLATQLTYQQFDPSPFPSVMAVLEREGIDRPPAVEIPFKCPPPEQPSIAVLPFVNMSADPENEFFSDGIAEEILNVLARIPALKVAARTSSFAYKGSNTNIATIAGELSVNHVLEGSVRKAGNQVRVTAQLIKAEDGFHLWSETFDRELTNIFAIQDEIAAAIADALKVSLELESGGAGNLTGTRSIEAYENYLRGMQLWHLRTAQSLTDSIEAFKAAIALDPAFPKAHAGLALAWSVIDAYINMDGRTTRHNAQSAAERALELDPNDVEALTALGLVKRNEMRFTDSVRFLRRAIELNPSFASAHQWYGGVLAAMGDVEASLEAYKTARDLDPRSRIIGHNLAVRLAASGHMHEAIAEIERVVAFAPDFPESMMYKMQFQMQQGACEEAADSGHRLARMLNKSTDSTQVYVDLCQRDDPSRRTKAAETLLAWLPLDFADPAHPGMSYEADIIPLLIELGLNDAAWAVFLADDDDKKFNVTWLRMFRTPKAVRFQCADRYRAFENSLDIPPSVVPMNCEELIN